MIALLTLLSLANAQTARICVDPGHGGSDPGAVGNGLEEADLNLTAGLAFRTWMQRDTADAGGGGSWDVVMTRTTDVYVGLAARCDIANASPQADLFLSIHTNAGGGNGTETYAYASGGNADTLAHRVQEEVVAHLGTNSRGVKYSNFYVLVNTDMPADLNEMAFIDVWTGNAELLADPDNLDDVGLAHLHAVQRYHGLTAYTPSTTPTTPTATVTLSDYPTEVETGETFAVTVDYQTNLWEIGRKGKLGVRMEDEGWTLIDEVVWDNGGAGIQGPSGSHAFEFEAPGEPGSVIFVAWLGPQDGDFDDRYDDASTASDPTDVVEGDTDTDEGDDTGDTGEDSGGDGELRGCGCGQARPAGGIALVLAAGLAIRSRRGRQGATANATRTP